MLRAYATRTRQTPQQCDWALAAPSVGPGFVSTAFSLNCFANEAKHCWFDFTAALENIQQADSQDLDASDLRLPSLKEEADFIVEQKLKEEREQKLQKGTVSGAVELAKRRGAPKAKNVTGRGRGRKARGLGEPSAVQAVSDPYANSNANTDAVRGNAASVTEGRLTRSQKRQRLAEVEEANGALAAAADEAEAGDKAQGNLPEADGGPRQAEGEAGKENAEGKGTRHWRPSGDVPDLLQPEDIAFVPNRGGRYKQEGHRKNAKRAKLPQFGGEGNDLEQKRLKTFQESALVLNSVAAALETPSIHCTAFQVRPDRIGRVPHETQDNASTPLLKEDETILRIDVREFDALHVTHQEVLVPGSQKMSVLRDAIKCPADRNMEGLGMAVHGAFFYMEGVFYVDRRKSAVDYVTPIRVFCDQHAILPPPEISDAAEGFPERKKHTDDTDERPAAGYRQMDMSRVSWSEIGLRVGPAARNVFCHQGCCEHLLVIKDVRRIHPDDPATLDSYPHTIQEEAQYRRVCDICSESMAQKVTFDDRNAPQEPAFWCSTCYKMMHYDAQNSLLYHHKVFEYQGG